MRPFFFAILMLVIAGPGVWDCWAAEPANQTSIVLSNYLHQQRLPLVEARVIPSPDSMPALLLYGFVPTEFDKLDAEIQALEFLGDPDVEVSNLIKVTPELLSLNSTGDGRALASSDPSATGQSAADSSTPQSESPAAAAAPAPPDAMGDREAQEPLDQFDSNE
ncbi:MAG TPA: hypothetical protein VGH29_14460 [Candidatus Binataceae bacterium]